MSRTLSSLFAATIAVTVLLSFAAPSGAAAQELLDAATNPRDQANTRADLRKPPADGGREKHDIEVVESVGRNIPNPLTPQRVESFVTESVTTARAGHLLVTKSTELTTTCTPTSGVIYFLLVDDVPVRNSAVFSRTGLVGQVSGVTTDVVEAGTHTIKIGLMCTVPGAYPSGATVTVIGISSVIVLP